MIPAAWPSFSSESQGLLLIGMILGTVTAELFFSGSLSDHLVRRLSRGVVEKRTPEMRLWLFIPAAATSAFGLALFGVSLQYNRHWIIAQVAVFLFAFGLQVGNTTAAIYTVDCYPDHLMDIIAFYSLHLNLSAFASPFFIIPMQAALGWGWAFGTQAIIVLVFSAVFIPLFLLRGREMQSRRGSLGWEKNETELSGGSHS